MWFFDSSLSCLRMNVWAPPALTFNETSLWFWPRLFAVIESCSALLYDSTTEMLAIFVFQSMMNLTELKWQSSPSKHIHSHTNSIWQKMKVQRVEEGRRSNTYSGVQRAAPPPLQRINLQRAQHVPLLPSRAAQEPSVWKSRRWRIQRSDFSHKLIFWKYAELEPHCCRSVISATQMNNNLCCEALRFSFWMLRNGEQAWDQPVKLHSLAVITLIRHKCAR